MSKVYDQIAEAVALGGERAVIRVRATYQPSGGRGARIFPPTYPVARQGDVPYVIEPRYTEQGTRQDVLLDGVASEANRAEQALLRARAEGRVQLPLIEIVHDGAESVRLTSLDLPHRYADAYLLDSTLDGQRFDKTQLGAAFRSATPEDVSALFRCDPGSVVFGAWDSHRKGRQAKFPRVYASEIVGWDPEIGARRAGRMDPLNLTGAGTRDTTGELQYAPVGEKTKGQKLSEIGLGNIAPNHQHGGVTVSFAERTATLSMVGLDRLGFGSGATREVAIAARVTLAAYALVADRLAFGGPSIWLRSGCELVVEDEVVEWVCRGGTTEPVELTVDGAIDLFGEAMERSSQTGLAMDVGTVTLTPGKGLGEAIDFALTKTGTGGE